MNCCGAGPWAGKHSWVPAGRQRPPLYKRPAAPAAAAVRSQSRASKQSVLLIHPRGVREDPHKMGWAVTPGERASKWRGLGHPSEPGFLLRNDQATTGECTQHQYSRPGSPHQGWKSYKPDWRKRTIQTMSVYGNCVWPLLFQVGIFVTLLIIIKDN